MLQLLITIDQYHNSLVFACIIVVVLSIIASNLWIKYRNAKTDIQTQALERNTIIGQLRMEKSTLENTLNGLKSLYDSAARDIQQSHAAYVELQEEHERIVDKLEGNLTNWRNLYYSSYQPKSLQGKFLPKPKLAFDLFELYIRLSKDIYDQMNKTVLPEGEQHKNGYMFIASNGGLVHELFLFGNYNMIAKALIDFMDIEEFAIFMNDFAIRLNERNKGIMKELENASPMSYGEMPDKNGQDVQG